MAWHKQAFKRMVVIFYPHQEAAPSCTLRISTLPCFLCCEQSLDKGAFVKEFVLKKTHKYFHPNPIEP